MCFAQGIGPADDAKAVCVSCPSQSGLGNRCIERLLGGIGQLCVLSSGPHPSGDSTDDHLQVQDHHDCTCVARDVLVLGSGESVHKTHSKTSIVGEFVDSACLASGVSHKYSGRFPEKVVKLLRSLRGTPQGESMNQLVYFGKWCEESQV